MIPALILNEFGLLKLPVQFNYIPDSFDNSADRFLSSLLIPIIAGLFEEIEFRLVLTRFNKKYFDIFLSLTISHLIAKLFGQYFITYTEYFSNFLVQSIFVYSVFAVPVYFTLTSTKSHSSWFEHNWKFSFRILFYSLALMFAIAHLPTIDLALDEFFLWPAVILPFFTYAMVFSFVRIRIGLWYAVLLHFTIDLVIMMLRY